MSRHKRMILTCVRQLAPIASQARHFPPSSGEAYAKEKGIKFFINEIEWKLLQKERIQTVSCPRLSAKVSAELTKGASVSRNGRIETKREVTYLLSLFNIVLSISIQTPLKLSYNSLLEYRKTRIPSSSKNFVRIASFIFSLSR